jgi:hypothetical protein
MMRKYLRKCRSSHASDAGSICERYGDSPASRVTVVAAEWHRVCRVTTNLKVICPRCQQEGKPYLLVTIDIPGDDREVHGLCWTHRLRLLAKSADAAPSRETGKS